MRSLLDKLTGRGKPMITKEQVNRKVPRILVFNFETGEKLYTYRPEDWHLVCYAHEHYIKEYLNYLALYSVSKEQVQVALDKVEKNLDQILGRTDIAKNAADAKVAIQSLRSQAPEVTKAHEGLKEAMFCMFYTLEDEPELSYNDYFNARKLELIAAKPLLKSEVFFYLEKITAAYIDSFMTNTQTHLKHLNALLQVTKDLEELNTPAKTTTP